MARRPLSTYGGADAYPAGAPLLAPPPSRDRRRSLQPPPLATNFAVGSNLTTGALSTPFSATSMHTPFSQAMAAWGNPSPAGSRGQSPMAPRGAYNVQYNPSNWNHGQRQSSTTRENPDTQALDGESPPPPYQPRSDGGNNLRSVSLDRILANTEGSPAHTPIDTSSIASPSAAGLVSTAHLVGSPEILQSGIFSQHAPPSPGLNSIHLLRPPAGRRAHSEGFASSSSCVQAFPTGHDLTARQQTRPQSIALPGPPPGPPPVASRSQSLDRYAEPRAVPPPPPGAPSASQRPQVRVPLPESKLEPIPPTPAGWVDDSSPQGGVSRAGPVLHIDTINLNARRAQVRMESRTEGSTSGLNRMGAKRGSNRLWERRNQVKSYSGSISEEAISTTRRDTTVDRLSGSSTQSILIEDLAPQTRLSGSRGVPPKALPTPPLSQKNPESAVSMAPSTAFSDVDCSGLDEHSMNSLRQYRDLLVKEKDATNDAERLQLFADFILAEAQSRRQKYAGAFDDGTFNPITVRNMLFEPDGRSLLRCHNGPNDGIVVVEDADSSLSSPAPYMGPSRWNDYNPVLSPIASMSHDDMSSRGRPPSRWWESQSNSHDEGEPRKSWRTKRESKYMGVSKEALQEEEEPLATNDRDIISPDVFSNEKAFPDRFGFYEEDRATPVPPHNMKKLTKVPASPKLLDISRFITLPPPYPRHYPAVNNNHPDLAQCRELVRSQADLSELKRRASHHANNISDLRQASRNRISGDRKAFRSNVQAEIDSGNITFTEAAQAEAALMVEKHKQEKLCLQAEFEDLEATVVGPLHNLLNSRISQLDNSLSELQTRLHTESETHNFDRPQQEGDETPELLEFLTQTKWVFETRETVHRELFDLLSQRNSKYGEIVVLPYQQANNASKVESTKAFFAHDQLSRVAVYRHDSLSRHEQLRELVTNHVARATEMQSSAFWDIAPNLVGLLQRIPENISDLEGIKIPEEEYEENRTYHIHPYQYLYSLLTHAERSTYQFIESQINLQCLLHEVKSSLLAAKYKASQATARRDGLSDDEAEEARRSKEEAELTAELKQKVEMIETQWREAVGGQFVKTRDRVKHYLVDTGGWESMENAED